MTEMQLKSFLTLAKNLNFTKASRELCISQSTLSMHIAALEKNLGLTLFIRTKKNVSLSPEGEIVYPKFKRVLEMIEETVEEARNLHRGHANLLRIGYMNSVGSDMFLFNILDAFRHEHPDIKVEISRMNNNELIEKLDDASIDIAITYEEIMNIKSDVESEVIFKSPLCILSSKEMFDDRKHNPIVDNLKKETFIIMSREMDPAEFEYMRRLREKYDFAPEAFIEVESIEAQFFNLEMGTGVCLSDYSSRVYGDDRFYFYPIEDLIIKCSAVCKKQHKNPIIALYFKFLQDNNYIIKDDDN